MNISAQDYAKLFFKKYNDIKEKLGEDRFFNLYNEPGPHQVANYTRFISLVHLSMIKEIAPERCLHLLCEFYPSMDIFEKNRERSDYIFVDLLDNDEPEILVIIEHENVAGTIDIEIEQLFQLNKPNALKVLIGYYASRGRNNLDSQKTKIQEKINSIDNLQHAENFLFILGPNTYREKHIDFRTFIIDVNKSVVPLNI